MTDPGWCCHSRLSRFAVRWECSSRVNAPALSWDHTSASGDRSGCRPVSALSFVLICVCLFWTHCILRTLAHSVPRTRNPLDWPCWPSAFAFPCCCYSYPHHSSTRVVVSYHQLRSSLTCASLPTGCSCCWSSCCWGRGTWSCCWGPPLRSRCLLAETSCQRQAYRPLPQSPWSDPSYHLPCVLVDSPKTFMCSGVICQCLHQESLQGWSWFLLNFSFWVHSQYLGHCSQQDYYFQNGHFVLFCLLLGKNLLFFIATCLSLLADCFWTKNHNHCSVKVACPWIASKWWRCRVEECSGPVHRSLWAPNKLFPSLASPCFPMFLIPRWRTAGFRCWSCSPVEMDSDISSPWSQHPCTCIIDGCSRSRSAWSYWSYLHCSQYSFGRREWDF